MEFTTICSAKTFEDTLIYCEKLSREFSGWIARDAEMNGGGRRECEVRRRERERERKREGEREGETYPSCSCVTVFMVATPYSPASVKPMRPMAVRPTLLSVT